MNKREVFEVIIKIFGIGYAISLLSNIASFMFLWSIYSKYDNTHQFLDIFSGANIIPFTKFIPTIVDAIVVYLFLFRSEDLAKKFIPKEVKNVASKEEVVLLLVAIQGLSLMVSSLVYILSALAEGFRYFTIDGMFSSNMFIYSIQLFIYVPALILGIWMVLASSKISKWLWEKILVRFWK